MDRIDLHTHSCMSDGSLTPAELVDEARNIGLKAFALTDHDTVGGIREAQEAADRVGIELVHGVEISTDFEGVDVHVVGLDIDYRNQRLLDALEGIRNDRDRRNERMVELMAGYGVNISLEKLFAAEGENTVLTRGNFARYLVRIGYVGSIKEAFDLYLNPGMPYYLPKSRITVQRAISLILDAGGIPVFAHPMLCEMEKPRLEAAVAQFVSWGLKGIEVYYSKYKTGDPAYVMSVADRFGLKYSGGSDYHGELKPMVKLGTGIDQNLSIPYTFLERLRQP